MTGRPAETQESAGPAPRRIGLFFKEPLPGQVKTRLTPPFPATQVAALYRAFVEDTIALARSVPGADLTLFHGGDPDRCDPAAGIAGAGGLPCIPQTGSDLGERMSAALGILLATPGARALLLGTDAPDLPAELISQAFELLELNDIVLGPALDGGYYLVALRRLPEGLFDGIAWSTGTVLEAQSRRAVGLGLRTAFLPPWRDVDVPEDVQALRSRLEKWPEAAPATRRAMKLLASHK